MADEIEAGGAVMAREELVALVARAHQGAAYAESQLAGKELAAQSELPTLVAQNLGAGFGQWDFFPEAGDIVEFALAYKRPATSEDVWSLARAWADDDAAGRHTILALVGRDVLMHELRRVEVPELRELIDETKPARVREIRQKLGLAVGADDAPAPKAKTPRVRAAPKPEAPIPARMPRPEFKRPAKAEPAPPAKRFTHPKFGQGVLEAQSGEGPDAKLTIKFEAGSKTLLARYVTEV
jgi:hypothetical protein